MSGWVVSTTNHHGPGEGWTVEDGAFVGRQTTGQRGGLLMTERQFSDVEAVFEVQIDWGCDSGFYLRTTGGDRAYQVTLDHLEANSVGGIWGESFGTEVSSWDFTLSGSGAMAVPVDDVVAQFHLATWPDLWDPTGFNEVRVRIEGNPPTVDVWIADVLVNSFVDTQVRGDVEEQGPIGIQVHEGNRWVEGGTVRFRNIRVRDLTVDCEPMPDAGVTPPEPPVAGAGGSVNVPPPTAGSAVVPPATAGSGGQAALPDPGVPPGNGGASGSASGGPIIPVPPSASAGASSGEQVSSQSGGCSAVTSSPSSNRSPGPSSTPLGVTVVALALGLRLGRSRQRRTQAPA